MLIIDVERFGPRLATVSRHEDAAFFIWTKRVTERADVNDVGVLRIDNDGRDVFGLGESHVLPRLAAVGRFVNAIAERHAVAYVRFAGADPNDVGITRREGDVADRYRSLS